MGGSETTSWGILVTRTECRGSLVGCSFHAQFWLCRMCLEHVWEGPDVRKISSNLWYIHRCVPTEEEGDIMAAGVCLMGDSLGTVPQSLKVMSAIPDDSPHQCTISIVQPWAHYRHDQKTVLVKKMSMQSSGSGFWGQTSQGEDGSARV